jgi:UDP-glucose 4-epimerase
VRCLVTGGTGVLGSHLVAALLDRGCEVAVFVRPSSDRWRLASVLGRVWVIEGDLGAVEQAGDAIRQFGPQLVFHLAWEGVAAGRREDPAAVGINLRGSLALLEMAARAGCRGWLGVGSQAEYGASDDVLQEDRPVRPDTAYGVGKLCVGLAGREMASALEIRFLWLRLLAVFGPMDSAEHLIPYVITSLLLGRKPSLTSGEQRWDYLYVTDAAEAICRAALDTEAGGIFNLASGQPASVRRIVERIRDLIDPRLPLGFGERPYPAGRLRLQADISRFVTATGWTPRIAMAEGLRRTVEWHRARATTGAATGNAGEGRAQ